MNIILDHITISDFLASSPPSSYAGEIFGLDNNDISNVAKKIKYVWEKESLGAMMLNQEQKLQLAEHIVSLNISNSVICGNTDDEDYYSLVERVATGHGIKRKNNNKELCLLSAASKYCGHHNRKYPFYDSVNLKILKSWGYRGCDHDFPTYVKAFRDVQQKNGLGELTLRELDYYLWAKGTKPV